jgi:hypothetical protein
MFEDCRTPPSLLKPHETAIVDSGCICHFLLVNTPCLNKVKSQNPLTIRLPNGATMESSHTDALDIPKLNKSASIAHVSPGMANHPLLSFGQPCNEVYPVTFRNALVKICDSQELQIFNGARSSGTRLWQINLRKEHQQPQHAVANNVYELRNTGALVNYLHKAMFSPTKTALLQAIKNGHLVTWSGLTEKSINKHLKLTPTTTLGHMSQRRQNIRSTSKYPSTSDMAQQLILFMPSWLTRDNFTLIEQGTFPVRSSKVNWYALVCYVMFLTTSMSKFPQ